MEEEEHKEGEDVNQEENPDGEQAIKEEKPINPNSYIPVIEDMYKLFGEVFLDNKMEIVKDNKEVFDCTLLGILFSAGWGSPCRIFYKDLINIYNQMNDGETKNPAASYWNSSKSASTYATTPASRLNRCRGRMPSSS